MDQIERRLRDAGYYATHNGISHADLTAATFGAFERIMAERGKTYSAAHRAAIFVLCGTLTEVAQGRRSGRIVWPIPTGGGKTTVALAAMLALHELDLDHVGVVVCQNRIGSLCELRADLDAYGVPKEKVTLIHSSRAAPWPSDSHEPKDARQFVLLTHASVIDRRRLWDFAEWKGQPRLVLWDESLLTRTPTSVELRELGAAIGSLRHVATHPDHTELETAVSYLTACEAKAAGALHDLRESGERSVLVQFPRRSFDEVSRMREALAKVHKSPQAARNFLELSQEDARVVPGQFGGVISYEASIPRDLAPNVVVLDASWVCRSLLHLDETLQDAEELPQVRNVKRNHGLDSLAELKSYGAVEVTQVLTSGGRDAIVRRDLAEGEEPKVLPMVVDAIAESTSPVLVYHFKERSEDGADAKKALRDALTARSLGHLLTKTVEVDGTARYWLCFQTHGNETGFNAYNHCGLVILWGVLHDSETVVASKVAAAEANLDTDLSHERLRAYLQSEKHHRVLQALSRGTMRNPGEGRPEEAAPMKALVFDSDSTLRGILRSALPGVRWTLQPGPGRKRGVTQVAAGALVSFLQGLPHAKRDVASKTAKAEVEKAIGEGIRSQTWKLARDEALGRLPGWTLKGQRLKRRAA